MHGRSHRSVRRGVCGVAFPLALACTLVASGCEETPMTEIFVCYRIDPTLSVVRTPLRVVAITGDGGLDGGVLRLEDMDQSQLLRDGGGGDVTAGWTRAAGSASDRLHFTLGAVLSTLPLAPPDFVQEADVPFVRDHIVSVRVSLESACRTVMCPSGQTCVAGACVPIGIEPSCMPDYGGVARGARCDARTTVACPAP